MSETPDQAEAPGQAGAPEHDGDSIEEIARQHPSAGDDSQVEGSEQADNSEEQAQDGGPGAGEDYAGSGL